MAAIVVVLALAGAATALAAARDPGVTAPAPERIARSAVHSVTNAPEADATGGAPWSAHRVSPDSTSEPNKYSVDAAGGLYLRGFAREGVALRREILRFLTRLRSQSGRAPVDFTRCTMMLS